MTASGGGGGSSPPSATVLLSGDFSGYSAMNIQATTGALFLGGLNGYPYLAITLQTSGSPVALAGSAEGTGGTGPADLIEAAVPPVTLSGTAAGHGGASGSLHGAELAGLVSLSGAANGRATGTSGALTVGGSLSSLLYPVASSVVPSPQVVLRVKPAPGAVAVRVEVSSSPTFAAGRTVELAVPTDTTVVPALLATLPFVLADHTRYYIRVRESVGGAWRSWATSTSFLIDSEQGQAAEYLLWRSITDAQADPNLWSMSTDFVRSGENLTLFGTSFGASGVVRVGTDYLPEVVSWVAVPATAAAFTDARVIDPDPDGGTFDPAHDEVVITLVADETTDSVIAVEPA